MLTEVGVSALSPPPLLPSLPEFLVLLREFRLVSTGVRRTGGPENENSVTAFSASWQQSGIPVSWISVSVGVRCREFVRTSHVWNLSGTSRVYGVGLLCRQYFLSLFLYQYERE